MVIQWDWTDGGHYCLRVQCITLQCVSSGRGDIMRSQAEPSQKQFKLKSDQRETKKTLVTCILLRLNHLSHCVCAAPDKLRVFFLHLPVKRLFATRLEDTAGASGPKWQFEIAAWPIVHHSALPVENNNWLRRCINDSENCNRTCFCWKWSERIVSLQTGQK